MTFLHFPLYKQSFFCYNLPDTSLGPVVQSVSTPACHAGGRRFESVPGRHKKEIYPEGGSLFIQRDGCEKSKLAHPGGYRNPCPILGQGCKRVLLRCPVKSSGLRFSSILPTAATRSGRFIRHRRRFPRSPFRVAIKKRSTQRVDLFLSRGSKYELNKEPPALCAGGSFTFSGCPCRRGCPRPWEPGTFSR